MSNQNIIFPLKEQDTSFIKSAEIKYHQHRVFLDKDIDDPSEYRELIDLLFSASEMDEIQIFINSVGGQLRTAQAIIEGIKLTQANVTGIIIGDCHSAASMIALYCHNVMVLDSASMMIHTAYTGSEGIVSNMQTYSSFLQNKVEKLLHETYDGFLTKEEIEKVKLGIEIWLDAEEIRKRYEGRIKYLDKKYKQLEKKTATAKE